MAREVIDRIKSIEEEAHKMVGKAEKEKQLILLHARKNGEKILAEAGVSARAEAQSIIDLARQEAEKEKKGIEQKNAAEIEDLYKRSRPRIEKAKELCR